jgi:hypothetical protein
MDSFIRAYQNFQNALDQMKSGFETDLATQKDIIFRLCNTNTDLNSQVSRLEALNQTAKSDIIKEKEANARLTDTIFNLKNIQAKNETLLILENEHLIDQADDLNTQSSFRNIKIMALNEQIENSEIQLDKVTLEKAQLEEQAAKLTIENANLSKQLKTSLRNQTHLETQAGLSQKKHEGTVIVLRTELSQEQIAHKFTKDRLDEAIQVVAGLTDRVDQAETASKAF